MSSIRKPPPILVNEDLIVKHAAKRPVSRLTELHENDATTASAALDAKRRGKPLTRAERRRLESLPEETLKPVPPRPTSNSSVPDATTPALDTELEEAEEARLAVYESTYTAPVEEEPQITSHETEASSSSHEGPRSAFNDEAMQAAALFAAAHNKQDDSPKGKSRLIAANPELQPEHMLEFTKAESATVRAAVASNESASLKILNRLKKDSEPEVIVALIGNPSYPAKALSAFVSRARKEPVILAALLEREDLTASLEKRLAKIAAS